MLPVVPPVMLVGLPNTLQEYLGSYNADVLIKHNFKVYVFALVALSCIHIRLHRCETPVLFSLFLLRILSI